mmetsp:Transcript_47922/g.126415  ORF Transcript_47922/g.126415 Transcript_47922/m.126415 type:complete len:229 (-) Transcript_47922:12-698(-)
MTLAATRAREKRKMPTMLLRGRARSQGAKNTSMIPSRSARCGMRRRRKATQTPSVGMSSTRTRSIARTIRGSSTSHSMRRHTRSKRQRPRRRVTQLWLRALVSSPRRRAKSGCRRRWTRWWRKRGSSREGGNLSPRRTPHTSTSATATSTKSWSGPSAPTQRRRGKTSSGVLLCEAEPPGTFARRRSVPSCAGRRKAHALRAPHMRKGTVRVVGARGACSGWCVREAS